MKPLTLQDYFKTTDFTKLSSDQQTNSIKLLQRVNNLLTEFGQERGITSGYRSIEDHKRIYAEKNAKRKAQGLPELSIPMGSKHLVGAAIDIADSDEKLDNFCTDAILQKYDLYREHPDETKGWTHLQCLPPLSQHRTFKPY